MQRSPTIGVLSSRVDDLYELQWLGAADAAAAHGVDIVTFVGAELASTDGYKAQANAIYDLVGPERLDGLIVWTTAIERFVGSTAMDEFCRRFDPLPIVSVERVLPGSPSVLMDERRGMDDAVSHLIEVHGCERIAFIRGPANHKGAEHRYQGYRAALARHGLPCDPALTRIVDDWATRPAAVAATELLTNGSAPPDAFATANDDLALGVIAALDAEHLRVPSDVAVVGFDDHIDLMHHGIGLEMMMQSNLRAQRDLSLPAVLLPLTTVRAPFYELGGRAVELLLGRLNGETVPEAVTLPTQLVVRRSCGCFSSAVREVVGRRADGERSGDTGWEQVANEMRHALPRSQASLPADWPERLQAAFVKDIETGSAAAFLELLDALMRASMAAGDTPDEWSRALSILRRHTAGAHPLADTSAAVEDFWLRVHSLVRELAGRLSEYERFDAARRDRVVRATGRRLSAAHDVQELTEVLAGELPELGIPSCYLAMYRSEGEREAARSLLVYEGGGVREPRTRTFRSRELAPSARLGTATPSSMVAMPLYFQERRLGFALFEVRPRLGWVFGWVYGELQEQLSGALHSALLIEREHDALAAVEQARSELEQRVALRTAELATANRALARLADEQAALRRVATLVAEGAAPTAVFDAVAAEIERLLDAHDVVLSRYEPGAEVTVVAHRGAAARPLTPGTRLSHNGEHVTALVRGSGRPARMVHSGAADRDGVEVSVGAPVVVEGRLWGVVQVGWSREESPPAEAEERMARFAELLETAIANADSRAQLNASRARLLTEGDEARRRVVRDLHDGAQQSLVNTILTLKLANQVVREAPAEQVEALVAKALEHAERGNTELRELAHGLLPGTLTRGGLGAGVRSLAARLALPVQVEVPAQRFPEEIERSAYFIVSESLTNVVKHADARQAQVSAFVDGGMLHVEVRDDGMGGADPGGHGLVGLRDRASALGGQVSVESPPGGGTLVTATLPLPSGE
jgi:DNA-binding LacI/PurR family transcriptional regulator/signal transduction histidine kinase